MRRLTAVGGLMLATALAVTGCSGGSPSAGSAGDAPREVPSVPVITTTFGKPTWGVRLSVDEHADAPLVTADRVLVLTNGQLYGYDAAGKEVWAAAPKGFSDKDRVKDSNGYPLLRQVTPEVVAVVDAGKATGEGIAEDAHQARATLFNLADGKVVKEVTVRGTDSDTPSVSKFGLAFVTGDTVTSIRSDGSTEETPLKLDERSADDATEDAGTIGDVTVTRTGDGGYAFPTWNTASKSLVKHPSGTRIDATDNDDLVVVSWHQAEGFRSKAGSGTALLRVSTGEVVAKLDCTTDTFGTFSASPNGKYLVRDGLRIATSGTPECIGGGDGEKTVDLTAVTDDGRAFGSAGDLFVDVPAGGEAKTAPRDGAKLPIGVMNGNVAVHWDRDAGVLTGNPIT